MATALEPLPTVVPTVIDRFDGPWACLSNFWIEPDGMSGEHRFQAAKTLDPAERRRILTAPSPGQARKLGRACEMHSDWEAAKTWVMAESLAYKFTRWPELRARLMATGMAVLVEGNHWHDQVWGDCRCGRAACASVGGNLLGVELMALRAGLRRVSG